jgi:uncharacterized membrane protein YbhN (UPF0104 family)
MLLTTAFTGNSSSGVALYVATYTISYLVGYLVFFAPGGLGFREGVLLTVLPAAALATPPQAALVTIASRVWITILEVTPALFFLVAYRMRHRPEAQKRTDATT